MTGHWKWVAIWTFLLSSLNGYPWRHNTFSTTAISRRHFTNWYFNCTGETKRVQLPYACRLTPCVCRKGQRSQCWNATRLTHPTMFDVNHWKGWHGQNTIENNEAHHFCSWIRSVRLERENHITYLKRGLNHLSRWMVVLDASKPWLAYWILHSLDLLEADITPDIIER